jgi:hypothetical protein
MKKLWLALAFITSLLSCDRSVSEFQTQNFVKYFGGGQEARGYDVVELSDGFIVAGFNSTPIFKKQVFVVRTDRAGNALWSKQFGTTLNEEGKLVSPITDGFYIVGHSTNDITSVTTSFLLKLGSQGDSLSTITIGGGGYSLIINDFAVDDQSVYLAGESFQNSSTQSDYFIAKYDHSGNTQWQRTFASNGSQGFKRIFLKDDGNILAVGTNNAIIGSTFNHIAVIELSPQGLPVSFVNLPATIDHFLGDALFDGSSLVIAYNIQQQGEFTAQVVSLSSPGYTPVWSIENQLNCQAKAIAKSSEGIISLLGDKSNAISLYQFNASGSITLTSDQVKSIAGFVHSAIRTSDNGWAFIGNTADDYGTMMQLVKTDKDLFLFEQ